MMKIETVQQRLRDKHSDIVTIREETYEGYKKHATFHDIEFGDWCAFVYSVCKGTGHPNRHLAKIKLTLEKAQTQLDIKHNGLIKIKPETWTHVKQKCTFIDADFGEWTTTFAIVMTGKGHPQRVKQHRSESQKWTHNEIQERLDIVHNGTVRLIGPYLGMGTKCKFADVEFGEFEAFPVNVTRGTGHAKRAIKRREETTFKRFGVKHHLQNDEQFQKAWKARCKQYRIQHWKTKQELLCTASWELKTVQWLNERHEDFIWQPRAFKMPDGRTYRPDAYLIERDVWIDIKGFFTETSKQKCQWFKTIMPNFEIWDKPKLLELGIQL